MVVTFVLNRPQEHLNFHYIKILSYAYTWKIKFAFVIRWVQEIEKAVRRDLRSGRRKSSNL